MVPLYLYEYEMDPEREITYHVYESYQLSIVEGSCQILHVVCCSLNGMVNEHRNYLEEHGTIACYCFVLFILVLRCPRTSDTRSHLPC